MLDEQLWWQCIPKEVKQVLESLDWTTDLLSVDESTPCSVKNFKIKLNVFVYFDPINIFFDNKNNKLLG